jgi:ACR3 family arsenite efflux pump ArsB
MLRTVIGVVDVKVTTCESSVMFWSKTASGDAAVVAVAVAVAVALLL